LPYSKRAGYFHKRQKKPDLFIDGTFYTLDAYRGRDMYRGEKYKFWLSKGSGAKIVVAKLKLTNKYAIQSILIPKEKYNKLRKKHKKDWYW